MITLMAIGKASCLDKSLYNISMCLHCFLNVERASNNLVKPGVSNGLKGTVKKSVWNKTYKIQEAIECIFCVILMKTGHMSSRDHKSHVISLNFKGELIRIKLHTHKSS